ncbi:MAG: 3-deoxy-manno-octulosonate cytidylyltransferase [Kiritimatiellae bacterium]|nr:3-deoxy-manno-octulosonate cytidylyltransferase [Kiritimatiellia bacterium]
MKVLGVIPARYGSSRLPGKPLKDICGKPMIQHVYENCCKSKVLDEVVVAVDDQRVYDAVIAFGGKAVMTRVDHPTGSDRVAEAANQFDCDYVINIQGDEPLVPPEIIDDIANGLINNPDCVMATGSLEITGNEEYIKNNTVVKLVTDNNGYAIYFSRSPIPYPRNAQHARYFEHIGIYAYTHDFLNAYTKMPATPLSESESLEQLKVLENGYKIKIVPAPAHYEAVSVDTEEDLQEVIRLYKERHGLN